MEPYVVILLLIGVIGDLVTTAMLIKVGGIEKNPVAKWLMAHSLWYTANAAMVFIGIALVYGYRQWIVSLVIGLAGILRAYVASRNLEVWKQLKK